MRRKIQIVCIKYGYKLHEITRTRTSYSLLNIQKVKMVKFELEKYEYLKYFLFFKFW